jgi:hypothetical protein
MTLRKIENFDGKDCSLWFLLCINRRNPKFMIEFIIHFLVIEDTYNYIHYNHYERVEKDT